MDISEHQRQLLDQISQWLERAEIARAHDNVEVASAAEKIAGICQGLLECQRESERPEILRQANRIRKQIESSEQHRTMCVEHGLSDAAIDATYEIQELEKQLVAVIRDYRG